MSSIEKWEKFLTEENIAWEKREGSRGSFLEIKSRVDTKNSVNDGYDGLSVIVEFDKKENLISFGIWE